MLISALDFDLVRKAKETVELGFIGLWCFIDGLVYKFVSVLFALFYELAENQLFDNSLYRAVADRVYLFIGVIALFVVSVSLLKALVNPDEVNKGVIKSFKALVTSIILLVLMPTIFKYAFSLQSAILQDNLIGKIFQINLNDYKEGNEPKIAEKEDSMYQLCSLDTEEIKRIQVKNSQNESIGFRGNLTENRCYGNYITMTVLEAFFTPVSDEITNKNGTKWNGSRSEDPWSSAKAYMIFTGNFTYITTFAENAYSEGPNNAVSYTVIISTAAAAVLIYLLISFSIDLGVRAAKLAFYQLISPIPILMRIIPGKEGQFDKWLKATVSTFLELFVRILIISFAIFMISNVFAIFDSMVGLGQVNLIGKAILAMGLLMFAKQAPKLLGEALGFDGGNLKFKIRDKLAEGGALTAATAAGTGALGMSRNLFNGFKEIGSARGIGGKIGAALRMPFSAAAGGVSGIARGAHRGWGAKTYGDVRKSVSEGTAAVTDARDRRANYRAAHSGFMGVPLGHVADASRSVAQTLGIQSGTTELTRTQSQIQALADAQKAVDDRAEKIMEQQRNERHATVAQTVAGVGNFTRLGDIQNEIEIMKSTGHTSTGAQVSSNMLTNMSQAEIDLKKQLKKDIVAGIDKNSGRVDTSTYDNSLRSLVTDMRTKAKNTYSVLEKNIDRSNHEQVASLNTLRGLVNNSSESFNDFITNGHALPMYDGSKKAITGANEEVKTKINQKMQKEQSK